MPSTPIIKLFKKKYKRQSSDSQSKSKCYVQRTKSMIAECFSKMVQVKRNIFNILLMEKQNKNCQTINLIFYIQWKFLSKIKCFKEKKLRECIASISALQEMLNEVDTEENKNRQNVGLDKHMKSTGNTQCIDKYNIFFLIIKLFKR